MAGQGNIPGPSATLRAEGLRPRKSLGQNFLRDPSFLDRIVSAADVAPDAFVVEVGAGTGVLTDALLRTGATVLSIELDDSLLRVLGNRFAGESRLRLWPGNALDFDPCSECPPAYKLTGNIPYYITGPLVRHFLEHRCRPQVLVLMVQREVAERMTAGPGDLSLLGVSVQFYARPEIVTRVPSGAFYPPPKVDSAIVRLVPYGTKPDPLAAESFFTVARAGFSTRRKQLINSLAKGLQLPREETDALLGRAGIDPTRRAETLTLDEWRALAAGLADVVM